MTAFLRLDALAKRFGELTVLDHVSLDIGQSETLALLGPSGSGKTTLLRAIAGFEQLDEGSIVVSGEEVTDRPPAKRGFGMVFQHYALFPHMSVAENVAFGLESRGLARQASKRRVEKALELVELEGFGGRRVDQISGGQQQRVALARALAPEPRVLLLDEPLSNLDPALRERTRRQIRRAVKSVGTTAVWVTHEQEEAFDVGDRVAVLHQGVLEQVGRPEDLYLNPSSPFVARFVGRASIVDGIWSDHGLVSLEQGEGPALQWPAAAGEPLRDGERVTVYFRPEGLQLTTANSEGAANALVVERRYGGAATLYTLTDRAGRTLEVAGEADSGTVGDEAGVKVRSDGPAGIAFRNVLETGE